jgi:hypothetical protein
MAAALIICNCKLYGLELDCAFAALCAVPVEADRKAAVQILLRHAGTCVRQSQMKISPKH